MARSVLSCMKEVVPDFHENRKGSGHINIRVRNRASDLGVEETPWAMTTVRAIPMASWKHRKNDCDERLIGGSSFELRGNRTIDPIFVRRRNRSEYDPSIRVVDKGKSLGDAM